MTPETIQALIEKGIPGAQVEVMGDDGVHFEALIVADAFDGQSRVARHRMVYAALGELMGGAIHALSFKTYTSAEHAALS